MKRSILTSFLFFGFLGILHADDPIPGSLRQFIDLKDSQGLMDYNQSDDIPDQFATVANNLNWSLNGSLASRRGSVFYRSINQIPSVTPPFQPRYFWVFISTTNTKYFFTKVDDQIRHINFNSTFDNQLASILTSKIGHINVNGIGYIVNESSPIFKIIEQTPNQPLFISQISGSPAGNLIGTHLDRMLVAGSTRTGEGMRIYFSSSSQFGGAKALETWPAINYADLNTENNAEYITCMGDQIFGNKPIYTNKTTRLAVGTVYPSDTSAGNIVFRTISNSIGCLGQETVKTVKGRQLFFSPGQYNNVPGIYEFNGISIKERTKQYRRFFLNNVQVSTAVMPLAFVYKDEYCIVLASINAIYPNITVCLDENDRLHRKTFPPPSNSPSLNDIPIGSFDFIDNAGYFVNGAIWSPGLVNQAGNIQIMQYDIPGVGRDQISGNTFYPIPWEYKTKDFDLGKENKNRPKTPERLYIKHSVSSNTAGGSSIINVVANFDFGKSTLSWVIDTSSFYKSGDIQTVEFSSMDAIQKLKMQWSNINTFNYVNFDIYGTSQTKVSFLDFYAIPSPLK